MQQNNNPGFIANRVIVTLTTIPTRLTYEIQNGFKECIKSLLNQAYENYEIHFNIPYVNKATGEEYIIPEELENESKIKIFRTEDLGPATKLIPTVERITDPETIIVVVDDDLIYYSEMLQAQVDNQLKWSDAVIGYDGLRSRGDDGNYIARFGDGRDYFYTSQQVASKVDILQHYKTISYKRSYFEDDFFDFVKENYSWSDDLLMAAYFSSKKRDRIVEIHPLIPNIQTHEEWCRIGGALTFPVLAHINHESQEGCNIFRTANTSDNSSILFRFIDQGYTK
jgi:glycosyltransferase involved in cell wall biosynthesis